MYLHNDIVLYTMSDLVNIQDKLKNAQLGHTEEIILNNVEKRTQPISTENLLSRVNNSGSVDRTAEEDNDLYEKNSNSGTKLHQLLDASPRADAVAAGWSRDYFHGDLFNYVVLAYFKPKITANNKQENNMAK